jgi:ribonuclease J
LSSDSAKINGTVSSGRVLVDGLGVGDVGSIVLRDRKLLSQDGLIVVVITIEKESGQLVAGPDIISRGFVYVREAEDLIEESRDLIKNTIAKFENSKNKNDWSAKKGQIKDELRNFLFEKTKRKPVILPIIMEI